MSYEVAWEFDHGPSIEHSKEWAWAWIGLLGATKALDAGTTAVGLLFVPGLVEANPFPASVFGSVGVGTGLVVLSVLTVVVVTLVTEAGARYLEGHDEAAAWGPTATRLVGYGPLSIVFLAASLHNAGLILRVLLVG